MEHKHTAGPWGWSHRETANGNYSTQVYDASGKEIATIAWYPVRVSNITMTSREANARLIAAAPDLLGALQAALDYGSMTGASWIEDKARAAIAKATGEPASPPLP